MYRISLFLLLVTTSCFAQIDTAGPTMNDAGGEDFIGNNGHVHVDLLAPIVSNHWHYSVKAQAYLYDTIFIQAFQNQFSALIMRMNEKDIRSYLCKESGPCCKDSLAKRLYFPVFCNDCISHRKRRAYYIFFYNDVGTITGQEIVYRRKK